MEFGLFLPQVAMDTETVQARAMAADELGFRSLWLFDHLFPPGMADRDSLEGWTLATHLLARTRRIRVGHLVLCAGFRHPALLAKMAATLDVLSQGRLDLGVGSGSVADEHHRAGLPWGSAAERAARLEETLTVLDAMLTSPVTSHHGDHVHLRELPNLPQPVQRPRPPIHVGGVGARTIALAARHADVWNLPAYGLGRRAVLQTAVDDACRTAGRDPATLARSEQAVLVMAADATALDEARATAARRYGGPGWGVEAGGYVGTPDTVVRRVAEAEAAGIGCCIFLPHDRGTPQTLELFAERVMPAFA